MTELTALAVVAALSIALLGIAVLLQSVWLYGATAIVAIVASVYVSRRYPNR